VQDYLRRDFHIQTVDLNVIKDDRTEALTAEVDICHTDRSGHRLAQKERRIIAAVRPDIYRGGLVAFED
jgi:hypothetical protein